jgi:hypothetical protein
LGSEIGERGLFASVLANKTHAPLVNCRVFAERTQFVRSEEQAPASAASGAKTSDAQRLRTLDVVGTRMVNEAHGREAGDAMIRRARFLPCGRFNERIR